MKHVILYGYLLFHIQAPGIKLTSNVINYSIAIVFNVLNCIKILGYIRNTNNPSNISGTDKKRVLDTYICIFFINTFFYGVSYIFLLIIIKYTRY